MRITRARLLLALAPSLVGLACAEGGSPSVDGSVSQDASIVPGDAGRDAGRDAGGGACGPGQHRCGGGCVDDLANDPVVGCRFGCGDPCPTPPDGSSACTADGACSFDCEPPFFRDGSSCVCRARTCADLGFMCGSPDDGCGRTLDCGGCEGGGVCTSGTCSCPLDAREPNNSRLQAVEIARMSDTPDSSATFPEFTLHSASDQDWFTVKVTDGLDFGNPRIGVELDRIPEGSDYDLAVWYICDSGSDQSPCTVASPCRASSVGTSKVVQFETECGGTSDEDGTLWLHVTSARWSGSCSPYRLRVDVQ